MIKKNSGRYNKKITIVKDTVTKDPFGFPLITETIVLQPYADVKTTRGYTLIASGSDFEKAYTNFTIRYPITVINRDMFVKFNGKKYSIEYLNNVNESNVELELQCKEVTK